MRRTLLALACAAPAAIASVFVACVGENPDTDATLPEAGPGADAASDVTGDTSTTEEAGCPPPPAACALNALPLICPTEPGTCYFHCTRALDYASAAATCASW